MTTSTNIYLIDVRYSPSHKGNHIDGVFLKIENNRPEVIFQVAKMSKNDRRFPEKAPDRVMLSKAIEYIEFGREMQFIRGKTELLSIHGITLAEFGL